MSARSVDIKWFGNRTEKRLCDTGDTGDSVHVRNSGEQNSELIAAFPADGIRQPKALLKAFGDAHQELITDVMTESVVDLLKAVEIEKEDGDPVACATCMTRL